MPIFLVSEPKKLLNYKPTTVGDFYHFANYYAEDTSFGGGEAFCEISRNRVD